MTKPASELVLIEVTESGSCAICSVRKTNTWCTSCLPPHYICPGCIESHKISRQGEQEAGV